MIFASEYKGISFYIPHNDDGVWHYRLHLQQKSGMAGRPLNGPIAANSEGYPNKETAIAAAKWAIDEWLASRESPASASRDV